MINFDDVVSENKTKDNKNWPYISDHPYRILKNRQFWIWKNKCSIEFNR